jgi:hypothetical protein
MNDSHATRNNGPDRSLLDEILRGGVPEIKLALGEIIDRENARPLPPRYARLLPETRLLVTLRSDAAEAVRPVARGLQRELTDSCNRHGSLYDRNYRVELQRTDDPAAPFYSVGVYAGQDEPSSATPSAESRPEQAADRHPPLPPAAEPALKAEDRPSVDSSTEFDAGRWVLIVEDDEGGDREAFRIGDPLVTVGRGSDDPAVRPSIAISDAPHVSRRQLAIAWEERDGAPGFMVYNLGLNTVRAPGLEVTGAHVGKGDLDLPRIAAEHSGWVPPGVPLRIGEHGPTLRIEEVPPDPDEAWVDPDATVFD